MRRFGVLEILFTLSLFTVLSACANIPTALAPSSSPLPPGVRGTIPAFGSDCTYYLLGIIPVTTSGNAQVALDDAKQGANVDVLTDVTLEFGGGYYILFSNNCVRVRGKGVPRDVLEKALKSGCSCHVSDSAPDQAASEPKP
jgi:hypothetical protein